MPLVQDQNAETRASNLELRISLTPWIIALASLTGVVAFLYPFSPGR